MREQISVQVLQVTRYEQNCSILYCESSRKAAVVDPGGDLWLIQDFLEWEHLELETILVTHPHCDHAGGVAELARLTGASVAGPHRNDEHLSRTLAEQASRYGISAENFTPDRWLENGDQIALGESIIDVLHCPGHTRGHVAYFLETNRQAFVGDILFHNTIGAWEHPDGDLIELVTSIRSKLFPLGDDVRFVPGHGPVSTFGQERQNNPFVSDSVVANWKRPLNTL